MFGTLANSRIEYNAAYFDLLEKETNSAFNEWNWRDQQVWVGNVYVQDFLTPGYTTSVSFHANRDHGETHYDHNGFLVRPAPIGVIAENEVDAYYIGWSGNGHIGRWNISHAFYQAMGTEIVQPDLGAAGGHQRPDGGRGALDRQGLAAHQGLVLLRLRR